MTRERAFTLVEVIVVVLIIATVLAIVFPRMFGARSASTARDAAEIATVYMESIEAYRLEHGGAAPVLGSRSWERTPIPKLAAGPVNNAGRPYGGSRSGSAQVQSGAVQVSDAAPSRDASGDIRAWIRYTIDTAPGGQNYLLRVFVRTSDGSWPDDALCELGTTAETTRRC